jgi:predicted nucleic acid-binding protein
MRVADSSVLYASIDPNDPRHVAARQALNDPEEVMIPLATWAEFLHLVVVRSGSVMAREVAAQFSAVPHVHIEHAGNPVAAQSIWDHNPKLSFVDAIGIQACLETGADLLSYDKTQLAALPKA